MDTRKQALLIAVVLALLVLGPALLYAYRSQTPALQTVPITQAIQEVQSGNVTEVTIEGSSATLRVADGTQQRTNVPDNAQTDPLEDAVTVWNRANPQRQIPIRRSAEAQAPMSIFMSVVLSLLPLIAFAAFVVLVIAGIARALHPPADRYERLAKIADLRDRGALTADEFEREKRKTLG